jgi:hypothetical protein
MRHNHKKATAREIRTLRIFGYTSLGDIVLIVSATNIRIRDRAIKVVALMTSSRRKLAVCIQMTGGWTSALN